MKAFWNDCDRGVDPSDPEEVNLPGALRLWSDEVRGVQGNFLGLVDDAGQTIQFCYDESIPTTVDDAERMEIVLMDFPQPERRGSCSTKVSIGQVPALLEKAFAVGADPEQFDGVRFDPW